MKIRKTSINKGLLILVFAFPFLIGATIWYEYLASAFLSLLVLFIFAKQKRLVFKEHDKKIIFISFFIGYVFLFLTSMLSGEMFYPLRRFVVIVPMFLLLTIILTYRDESFVIRYTLFGLLLAFFISFLQYAILIDIDFTALGEKNIILGGVSEYDIQGNRNAFGIWALKFAILISLALYLRILNVWVASFLFFFCLYYIFLSFSTRSVVASLPVIFAYFMFLLNRDRVFARVFALLGLVAILGFVTVNPVPLQFGLLRVTAFFGVPDLFGLSEVSGRLTTVAEGRVVGRQYLISSGLELFYENPVFGVGLENTRQLIGTYTHNDFIELLVSAGVYGPVPFYFAYLYIAYQIARRAKTVYEKLAFLGLFVAPIVIGMAGTLYGDFSSIPLMVLVFLVGTRSGLMTHRNNPVASRLTFKKMYK